MNHHSRPSPGARAVACASLLLLLLALASPARAQSGSLQFSSLAFSVKESTALAKISVSRLNGSSGTLTVDFATVDSGGGNATAGDDYVSTNGTLSFGPGVTSRYFYVPIVNDTAHEGHESIVLELDNISEGGTLGGQPSTTLTITDNDACSYAVSPTSRTYDEGGGLDDFEVLTPDGCEWTAESTAAWIGIFGGASGAGNGVVTYTYDPLPGDILSRTGTIRVGGKTFTIVQAVPPADLTPPSITFVAPAQGSRQTNASITVTGRASDNLGVTSVEVRLENSAGTTDYAPATGLETWSATVEGLVPGTNTVRIRAQDAAGNIQEAGRPVVYVRVSPLTLTTEGNGTVTGVRHGQLLDVGKSYSALAKPASGHFFNGWSGSVESAENPLAFEMEPDYSLQANFIASPFTAVAGAYAGLLHEVATIRHESSGAINVTVGALGTFSAKLTVAGKRFSFSGRFDLNGKATNTVPRGDAAALTVVLELNLAGGTDAITGHAGDGDWEAPVSAYRDVFDARANAAAQAGRYTVIIPGNIAQAAGEPGGDGVATLLAGKDGSAKLSGTLADGTKVSHKATLSKDGYWPLYLPLYGGRGTIMGWVLFNDGTGMSDLEGTLSWFKPADEAAKYYPGGFAIQPSVTGSRYAAPTNASNRVLGLTEGRVAFVAGNLAEDLENPIGLSALGTVTNLGVHKMVFSIQKSSGLCSGSVTAPGTSRAIPFRGAVHQKENLASGFFLGTNQSGRVRLSE